jgi:hypothetical protein
MTPARRASFIDSDMATRFLFDPPRRPKAKNGPNIKSLLVRCPSTAKLTDTGKTIDEKRWQTAIVKTQKFTCAHCGGVHTWTKKDVILGRPTY